MASSPFTGAVVASMRALYPESLADKSFDNTGLLLEAPFLPQRRNRNSVLLTIDLTRAVADEAIEGNHSVVVAYHPIIFRGLKALTLDDSQQQSLLRLAANGISVYCPHTAVDTVPNGMADWLCEIVTGKVDAPEPEAFTAPSPSSPLSETDVTTSVSASEAASNPSTKPTTPSADHDQLSDPFVSPEPTPKQKETRPRRPSGAHRTYSRPTYPKPTPTFHPGVFEHKRTVITPSPPSALEVANSSASTDAYTPTNTGQGRLITFNEPQPLTLLITRIAHAIGLPKGFPVAIPQSAQVEDILISTVGVCPGSGAGVLRSCKPAPDLIFTGEMSHHEALAVIERGGCVVNLFHSNSERGFLGSVMQDELQSRLEAEWNRAREEMKRTDLAGAWGIDGIEEMLEDEDVSVVLSERDRDPFGIVVLTESEVEGTHLS